MSIVKAALVRRIFKSLAALFVGCGVLAWVIDQSGATDTEVVVQVEEPDVELTIGDRYFRIDGRRDRPIVCELAPGRYRVLMRRGEKVLFEETIRVRRGETVVRTAYDQERLGRVPQPGEEGPAPAPASR